MSGRRGWSESDRSATAFRKLPTCDSKVAGGGQFFQKGRLEGEGALLGIAIAIATVQGLKGDGGFLYGQGPEPVCGVFE